jgi:hypothetical protein
VLDILAAVYNSCQAAAVKGTAAAAAADDEEEEEGQKDAQAQTAGTCAGSLVQRIQNYVQQQQQQQATGQGGHQEAESTNRYSPSYLQLHNTKGTNRMLTCLTACCCCCYCYAAGGYTSSEGRKQRKQLLAELKGLLPPSHTPLLVALLLQGDALQLQQQPGSSSIGSGSAARKAQMTGECVEVVGAAVRGCCRAMHCSSSSASAQGTDCRYNLKRQSPYMQCLLFPACHVRSHVHCMYELRFEVHTCRLCLSWHLAAWRGTSHALCVC